MKIFIPFCDGVSGHFMDRLGVSPGDLVPFQLEYECLRLGETFADEPAARGAAGAAEEPFMRRSTAELA